MTVEGAGLRKVCFPSEEKITEYIDQHPTTSKSGIDPRFVAHISHFFANKRFVLCEISGYVVLQIYELNDKLKLPSKGLPTITMNLSLVLKACAQGEKIKLKKNRAECEAL